MFVTYPKVHQISKHMTLSQKKEDRNEKWIMKAERKKNSFIQNFMFHQVESLER